MSFAPQDDAGRLRHLLGVGAVDYLLMEDVAAEFRFTSAREARAWCRRWKVPITPRGRRLLVDRRDVLATFERLTKRRA